MRRLPVFQSYKEVFSGVTRHYFELIGVAPVGVALILLGYAALIYGGFFPGLPAEDKHILASATRTEIAFICASWIAVLIGFIAAAVRWHKFVLLGERPYGSGSILFFWGGGQTRYLWTSLKLSLVLLFAIFVLILFVMFAAIGGSNVAGFQTDAAKSTGSTVAFIAVGLAYIALGYYAFRLSLAFPDAALGQGGSISEAWTRTEGNGWRLLVYGLLVQISSSMVTWIGGFVIGVVAMTVLSLPGIATPELTVKIGMVLTLPIMLFQLMATVTMLSVAYREIVGLPSDADPVARAASQDAQPA